MDIAIQRIERLVLLTLVHWIEIYPMDSVIQPSNNHVLQFVFYYQSCFDNDTLEKEILKIGRCGSLSVDCAEFGHCMLFFWICREQQRNEPSFITHKHSHCSVV